MKGGHGRAERMGRRERQVYIFMRRLRSVKKTLWDRTINGTLIEKGRGRNGEKSHALTKG